MNTCTMKFFMNSKLKSTPLVYLESSLIVRNSVSKSLFRDMNNIQQFGQLGLIKQNKTKQIIMEEKRHLGALKRPFNRFHGCWRLEGSPCIPLVSQDRLSLGFALENHPQLTPTSTLPLPGITFSLNNNQVINIFWLYPFPIYSYCENL